ncbi:hypothetical protein [Terrabacter sp. NPDC080008]|uniref:hypothetical protein n=1 Tax=Terrabacter sp. NPDC080008 TaxID=3155176 RepID=UPI00344D2C03
MAAWSAVHGLAVLVLDGPLGALEEADRVSAKIAYPTSSTADSTDSRLHGPYAPRSGN